VPTPLSIASWNVEHFEGKPERVAKVVELVRGLGPKKKGPDVFALYEVEGKDVFDELVANMPEYQFHITEGPEVQEILIGVRGGVTAFYTQRTEYKSGLAALRPGALLTVRTGGADYPILFLHTKALGTPFGFGVRDDQLRRALKFKRTLQKAAGAGTPVNFLFLGDLNTAGMEYPFKRDIDAELEIRQIERAAKRAGMRLLSKSSDASWWNGPGSSYPPGNFDHVVAASHLVFRKQTPAGAEVRVIGWPEIADPEEQQDWIATYSDHGVMYLELLTG